ncbi:M14 family zinc carboxypeptidase [Cohnella cholangitidis]|uniref:Carboxypeptidase n=1 Tax=Cohnella cholangitidis TaxID=2598458 RepID=A0A7G5BZI6_9BACL|nr:M14 family zinc carboxypeptidase [Cohnella cholangitidis]QMV42370.1 carboxypeptidase [Cohnella cholangitidis]
MLHPTTLRSILRTRIFYILLALILLVAASFPVAVDDASAASSSATIVNPKQVYTYEIMTRNIQTLSKRYPDLIRYSSAGKSEYNREIWVMEVGRGPINVLLNGSHHAREWISTILLMRMAEHIAVSDRKDAQWGKYRIRDLLDHVTFQIVPMVNPDGVTLQQKGLDAFPQKDHAALLKMNKGSRDFKRWKGNAKGVDLNRQYPADWERINDPAPAPHYMNYKGKKPLEAKEAQTMFKLANNMKPAIAVSYHSSGEILYWNYKTPKENLQRDLTLATAYSRMTGYRVVKPAARPSGGGFTDWFIQQFGHPGLTPELSPSIGERSVPLSNWDRIWRLHEDVAWLLGTTAVQIETDKHEAAAAPGWVELTKKTTAYQWPLLKSETFGSLPIGNYEVTRSKGSWLEIESEDESLRWISGLNSRKMTPEEVDELTKAPEEPSLPEDEQPQQTTPPVEPEGVQ